MWYRADTGYQHDRGTTAGDVVRYEQSELGNDIGVDQGLLPYLDTLPASRVVWVHRSQRYVNRHYGKAQAYPEAAKGKKIGSDGDGGYLILLPEKGA